MPRRKAVNDIRSQGQLRGKLIPDEPTKFGGSEEMNVEAPFGAGDVSHRKPAILSAFHHFVRVLWLGAYRVHPYAEQSTRRDAVSHSQYLAVGRILGAVLQDLNRYHDRVLDIGGQCGEIPAEEARGALRGSPG
jgi:hypothetical protein